MKLHLLSFTKFHKFLAYFHVFQKGQKPLFFFINIRYFFNLVKLIAKYPIFGKNIQV